MSQIQLLKTHRFLPLFWTQFLGAFNDNVYKNALVILIVFQGDQLYGIDTTIIVTICAGIFILPYFLFSATAGQFADKYEKSMLIRRVKFLEVFIMSCAMIGFYLQSMWLLMLLLFLMGTQSTLFGPLKFGILPQHLKENELVGGNGLISMGTFLAILLGTILGGILVSIQPHGTIIVGGIVIVIALLGLVSSFSIPIATASEPQLQLNWNIFTQTIKNIGYALEIRQVFIAILAMSWFWFVGATYLSQVPAYSKYILGSNNEVVTLLLTMFSVGIGVGSILCERLSKGKIELGLVTLGAFGILIFSIDIYFASLYFIDLQLPKGEMGFNEFMALSNSGHILIDLILVGLFGGFYIVPLNTLIQRESRPEHRARVIAANNILNALMMVGSAIGTSYLLHIQFSIAEIFLIQGILTAFVILVLFLAMPEFMQRFVQWTGLSKNP